MAARLLVTPEKIIGVAVGGTIGDHITADFLTSSGLSTYSVWTCTGPMRAFDFYSKFGVNGNLPQAGSPSEEITNLATVGISNIRDGANNQAGSLADAWFSYVAPLAAAGIRQHFFLNGGSGSTFLTPISDWTTALKNRIVTPYGAHMVTGVSGPNEADLQGFNYNSMTGITAANAAQADLYAAMKADPALSSIPVDMWPVSAFTFPSSIGDQTAHTDRANMHDYYETDNSGGVGVAVSTGLLPAAMNAYLGFYRQDANRAHFITTETGYGSTVFAGDVSNCSQYAQARLILMNYFDHARRFDCDQVYYFTLAWGPESGNWGLLNDDGTPKISGTAVHDTMQILNDGGASAATFATQPFSYSLSGMPTDGRNFVIARSDGSYQILLYQETPIWNVSTATAISLSNSTVTVSLPRSMSGSVYDPINNGTTPIATFSGQTSVVVTLNDAALIIQVS